MRRVWLLVLMLAFGSPALAQFTSQIPSPIVPYLGSADGTDQRANLVAALAANAGRTLHIPEGTYTFDYTNNVSVALPADTTIQCDPGATLSIANATGTRFVFSVLTSNVTVRDCSFAVTGAVAGSTIVFFQPGGGAANLTLDNVTIDGAVADGGGATITHGAWVFQPVGTVGSGFTGIFVRNSNFVNMSRLYVRATNSNQTAAIKQIRVVNNTFTSFYRSPISINSPWGETSDVVISGNRFRDNFGKTTGGSDYYAIGIGSGRDVVVTDNYIGGAGDGIHIEEAAIRQVIAGNVMALTDVSAEGIFVTDNNVGTGSYVAPRDITLVNNIIEGPGLATATAFGIRLANDASGTAPVTGIKIEGNTVIGFARGIQATDENEVATITGNTLRANAIGLWARKPLIQARGNLFDSNTEDLHSANGGMWGEQSFLAPLTASTDAGKIAIAGWDITRAAITLAATATTNVTTAPLGGSMLRGDITLAFRQADAVYALAQAKLDYDGSTLTTLDARIGNDGAAPMSGMVATGGNLAAAFVNSGAELAGGRLQARFRGVHMLN